MSNWFNNNSTILRYLVLLASMVTSCEAYSHAISHPLAIGHDVPAVSVHHLGEMRVAQQQVIFVPWSTHALRGKVRIIQLIPGKADARNLNQHLLQAISRADFDTTQYQTTIMINADDAFWGTEMFVKSSAMALKQQYPWMTMVFDENGQVARAWQLTDDAQATVVTDRQGKVR